MPGTIRLGALLALLAVAMALPGCGSDEVSGEIPADNAADLKSALADVRLEIEAGCTDPDQAREQAQAFVDEVNRLPADPSGELKTELQEAADHLRNLVDERVRLDRTAHDHAKHRRDHRPSTTTSSTDGHDHHRNDHYGDDRHDTTTSTDDAPLQRQRTRPNGVPPATAGPAAPGAPATGTMSRA